MNSIRMQYISDQLLVDRAGIDRSLGRNALSGMRVLDVGCGGGLLSESLARLGADVVAVDPSEELVASARAHSRLDPRTQKIDYRGGTTVEKLSSSNIDKFDAVCLLEVIEHIENPASMLEAISSLLKPEGDLFLSTMNRTTKSKLVAILGAEYVMRYLPVGTHDWSKFKSPDEVKLLLRSYDLVEQNVAGMRIESLPRNGKWSWHLDPFVSDVNWIARYKKVPTHDK